jgi:uncharacterized protein YjiS (DUF1127 family)
MSNPTIHGSIGSRFARARPDGIGTSLRSEMLPVLAIGLAATIRQWIARGRERRALAEMAELNDHLLEDIGLSRDEALREATKWFWQGQERYKVQR